MESSYIRPKYPECYREGYTFSTFARVRPKAQIIWRFRISSFLVVKARCIKAVCSKYDIQILLSQERLLFFSEIDDRIDEAGGSA
jgi:hypothetical protein